MKLPKQWEYITATIDLIHGPPTSEDLDEYGRDGWELVAAVLTPGAKVVHYFKRPKQAGS